MITGELKNKIDKLWVEFWTGGVTNPLTVIEQITFLMYARLLDMNEQLHRAELSDGDPLHDELALKAEEIANIAIYLASDESKFMTGQTISVDGGISI